MVRARAVDDRVRRGSARRFQSGMHSGTLVITIALSACLAVACAGAPRTDPRPAAVVAGASRRPSLDPSPMRAPVQIAADEQPRGGARRNVRASALGLVRCELDEGARLACTFQGNPLVAEGITQFEIVGNDAVCALDRDGRARFVRGAAPAALGTVDGVAGVVQIAHAGHGTCCALTRDGAVWCVGRRDFAVDRSPDIDVGRPLRLAIDRVRQLVYGAYAVREDGSVWLLTDVTGEPGVAPFVPRPVRGLRDAVAFEYTRSGPCALHRDGSVTCNPARGAAWAPDDWRTAVRVKAGEIAFPTAPR
jgi:hypothetical protein